MTPAPANLDAVKIMLFDALGFIAVDEDGDTVTDMNDFCTSMYFDSRRLTKLATTVAAWFAAREGRSGILDEVSKAGTPEEVRYKGAEGRADD